MHFSYHNPTKIHFGDGQIAKVTHEIPSDAKILVVIGGGSVKRNGVLEQVTQALAKHQWDLFEGVEPNPQYETLMAAVAEVKAKEVNYILAVGGGSVVDGCKFIAAAALVDGEPWDICAAGARVRAALPLGCILTLPATGSESNTAAVVSRGDRKLFFDSPWVRPRFAILDPKTTLTLPERQTANGVADAFVHVMEQYLTYPVDAAVQDRFSEGLLLTLVEQGERLTKNDQDQAARANAMWAATMALNGLVGLGVPQDWSTHMIGHEITALFGVDHARTLTIVLPAVMKVCRKQKAEKIIQYGQRVWGLNALTDEQTIEQAMVKTVQFFESLGMPTHLADVVAADELDSARGAILQSLKDNGRENLGEHGDLTYERLAAILAEI